MPFLSIGRIVRAVSDEVVRAWSEEEAAARAEAAAFGGHPVVWVRTDRHGVGAIPIRPDAPVVFTDDGVVTEPDLGRIIAASADPERISAETAAERGPEPEATDEEIADLVRRMKADRPDLDWENLLMGRLAGPASPDRPSTPVWEYPTLDVPLEVLSAVRFPVRYAEGTESVTSIDEELKPPARSAKGPRPRPRYAITAASVIARYAALHDAGVITWDAGTRGIAFVQPMGSYHRVLRAWARTLEPLDDGAASSTRPDASHP